MTLLEDKVLIPKFFAGKTVFITGGSGFMGKVLIEKLLRSCPDIAVIYALIRPKRGKDLEERLQIITDTPLFDRLKEEYPSAINKIIPVAGDVSSLGLGLSAESRSRLIKEVNVVYHVAASVRFDDPLKDAILMNTRGTREVALLAKEIKNLEVFMHISTTYSHTDKKVIEEKVYPPLADWKQAIEIAENVDPHILNVLTPHYIKPFPNTYTFTKRMAENAVEELCNGQIPAIILRPSIVISSLKEPVPGWIDNFNGPVGMMVGAGKGVLRSIYTNPDLIADYIPVDLVIKAMIIATWVKAMEKSSEDKLKLSVYNACNNNVHSITIKELVELGRKISWQIPFNTMLWYPDGGVTRYYLIHFLKVIFFHILPALLVDGLLKLSGRKPMLLKLQRKVYVANIALFYFITQEWTFINRKTLHLEEQLLPLDIEDFSYGPKDFDNFEYFRRATYGAKRYLLKEDMNCMEQALKNSKRMYVLHIGFQILFYTAVIYLLIGKLNVVNLFHRLVDRSVLYLDCL